MERNGTERVYLRMHGTERNGTERVKRCSFTPINITFGAAKTLVFTSEPVADPSVDPSILDASADSFGLRCQRSRRKGSIVPPRGIPPNNNSYRGELYPLRNNLFLWIPFLIFIQYNYLLFSGYCIYIVFVSI